MSVSEETTGHRASAAELDDPMTDGMLGQRISSQHKDDDEWIKVMPMEIGEGESLSPEDLGIVNNGIVNQRPFFANTTFYTVLRLLQVRDDCM